MRVATVTTMTPTAVMISEKTTFSRQSARARGGSERGEITTEKLLIIFTFLTPDRVSKLYLLCEKIMDLLR